jgi:hypothetical protein
MSPNRRNRRRRLFFHLLADKPDVPGLRINHGISRDAAARDRIRIFLPGDNAMLDDLGACRRQLAAYLGRRGHGSRSRRNLLLLRRAASQAKAQDQPRVPHVYCFLSRLHNCRWQP